MPHTVVERTWKKLSTNARAGLREVLDDAALCVAGCGTQRWIVLIGTPIGSYWRDWTGRIAIRLLVCCKSCSRSAYHRLALPRPKLTFLYRADEYMMDVKVPTATTAARQTSATKDEIDVLTSQDLHARFVRSLLCNSPFPGSPLP